VNIDAIREDHAPRVVRNRKPGEPGYFKDLEEWEGAVVCDSGQHDDIHLMRHDECHTATVLAELDRLQPLVEAAVVWHQEHGSSTMFPSSARLHREVAAYLKEATDD
jgi:hypothetical protein